MKRRKFASQAAFRAFLQRHVDKLLATIRENHPGLARTSKSYPCPYDITHGWCDVWAKCVCETLHNAEIAHLDQVATVLSDRERYREGFDHAAVLYNGLYYDAECLDGVADPAQLSYYLNAGKQRAEVVNAKRKDYPWERLAAFAHSMGGTLQLIDKEPETQEAWMRLSGGFRVSPSPFCDHLAICLKTRTLFLDREARHKAITVGCAIHELGHIFAVKERMDQVTETDFLGWEWQVAKLTGCRRQWLDCMHGYNIDNQCNHFGGLTTKRKLEVLREAVVVGKKYGNLSETGEPRTISQ